MRMHYKMCGFNFIYDITKKEDILLEDIQKMNSQVEHRGPDKNHYFVEGNKCFGHVRLSILDLTSLGSQPMRYKNLTLLFNGEIYNYKALKLELTKLSDNVKIEGNSDTEIVIKYVHHFGIKEFLLKARGMYAILVYNKLTNKVDISRDHFGQKPLHYYLHSLEEGRLGELLVSSEIGAISNLVKNLELDRHSINEYIASGYISAPKTIYTQVRKLKAGTGVSIDLKTGQINEIFNYNATLEYKNTNQSRLKEGPGLLNYLDTVVGNSVERHLISDVPVATLLSAGTDSTLISLYARERSSVPIEAFTIGFDDSEYDESVIALQNAKSIGMKHTRIVLSANDIINAVDDSMSCFSEPFDDPSSLVSNLVFKEVSKSYKVVLSGDGGDELFGGYSRYKLALRLHGLMTSSKHSASALRLLVKSISKLEYITPSEYGKIFDKIDKIKNKININNFPQFYSQLQMHSGEEYEIKAPLYSNNKLDRCCCQTYRIICQTICLSSQT